MPLVGESNLKEKYSFPCRFALGMNDADTMIVVEVDDRIDTTDKVEELRHYINNRLNDIAARLPEMFTLEASEQAREDCE